jgi:hypothetical protein
MANTNDCSASAPVQDLATRLGFIEVYTFRSVDKERLVVQLAMEDLGSGCNAFWQNGCGGHADLSI